MGQIIIQPMTPHDPITLIGMQAGVCYGADIANLEKNYRRGIDCLQSDHGRTFEFVDVYMILKGYSARVIREWYTHIGGAPTRLQASTRYIDYAKGFDYISPESISTNTDAAYVYETTMARVREAMQILERMGIPRQDIANLLPLGMTTEVVDKRNVRNLIDMSRQRECSRALPEFREMFSDIKNALSEYSEEWRTLINMKFMPKCKAIGYCPESVSCGRKGNSNE